MVPPTAQTSSAELPQPPLRSQPSLGTADQPVTSVKVVYERVIELADYAALFFASTRCCSGTSSRFSTVM